MVQPSLSGLERLELGVIGVQLALHCREIQRFKVKRDVTPIGPLWKALSLGTSYDGEDMPLLVVREEVLQTNTEHQGDA